MNACLTPFLSHPSIPQAAKVHNSATTEATEERTEPAVPQTYNSKQLKRIQETVWFEDSPSPRISNPPSLSSSSKSPSSRCPSGCWPLLHLSLGPRGLIPGVGGLSHGVRGLVPPPWGFHPTTASPVLGTSASTQRSRVYLRL